MVQRHLFSARQYQTSPTSIDTNISGRQVIGIAINPKKKEPVLVVTDETFVSIRSLLEVSLLAREGVGYYEEDEDNPASSIADLPRVHTPRGVASPGKGYGTSLYTALALGSYLTDKGEVEIAMGRKGDGICSRTNERSSSADKWWNAAVRFGLASQVSEEETEEYVTLSGDDVRDLDSCLTVDDGRVSYVNEVNVDIVRENNVEVYEYTTGYNRDLILAEIVAEIPEANVPPEKHIEFLWETIAENEYRILDRNKEALLALDVRGLDQGAMNLIAVLYDNAGFSDQDISALWYRWENRMDPQQEVRQRSLFSANGRAGALSDVMEARRITDWDALDSLP